MLREGLEVRRLFSWEKWVTPELKVAKLETLLELLTILPAVPGGWAPGPGCHMLLETVPTGLAIICHATCSVPIRDQLGSRQLSLTATAPSLRPPGSTATGKPASKKGRAEKALLDQPIRPPLVFRGGIWDPERGVYACPGSQGRPVPLDLTR